jgi:hypothetical protein
MKTAVAKLLVPLLLGVMAPSLLFATDYRYTKIETPTGTQAFVRGINARGDILGNYAATNGKSYDFLIRNGVFSKIKYPDGIAARAWALNAHGDIVGFLDDADGRHGFLFHDGNITKIDFPGADFTRAIGINNAGDITGGYAAEGKRFGFILRDGIFRKVHIPGEGPRVGVLDVDDSGGVMVGEVVLKSDSSDHPFIKRQGHVQFIDPPGTNFACGFAFGINQREEVAGFFAIVDNADECNAGPPTHGYVLRDGVYDIIDFPGSQSTSVNGINDAGVVVGVFTDKGGDVHGFKAVPKK